ncbi:MAG: sulfite exporter TauE/SafE family protein [Methylococcaceae bacterium]|nr:sulfite exporter TauE/SafE family protein [Methylococcaceae bacterium]
MLAPDAVAGSGMVIGDALYSLPTVFVLGLVFGMGPCTVTCLPFLGPVFLAGDGGLRQSWKIVTPFSMGRLCSYSTLGALSGLAGASVQKIIATPWVSWAWGGATIAVGLLIFLQTFRRTRACGAVSCRPLQDHPMLPSGLFFMGVGMAATPCAPLATVMVTSAATGSVASGLQLGLSFGLGAVIVPALVFGVGMAYFGQRIRLILHDWRVGLERASALLLVLIGVGTIWR